MLEFDDIHSNCVAEVIMKIVVTGALGHIGSKLIRELPSSFPGCDLVLVDNLSTNRYCSLFNLPTTGKYRFVQADITVPGVLGSVVDGQVDAVVHLAAMTDAAGSVERSDEVERNNFLATKQVAEHCAVLGTRLIALSSTSVYGTAAASVDETCGPQDLKPQSPYAATKLREEELVQFLHREKGLRASVFRFGTIFGASPGMRFHTAVNKFCWQAAMGQPITVWRTAFDQKRPYLDLIDACRAISHILKWEIFDGRVYNVLTQNATVRQITDAIREFVPTLQIDFVDSKIMNQLSYEVLDERFRSTGFVPVGNLRTALENELGILIPGLCKSADVP